MSDMITKLFPEGQRKLVMSLITLVVSLVLDHFKMLDENMKQSLLAILAIFVTGNIMEHLADALKIIKGTKVGQIIEDIIPGDQGLGAVKPGTMMAQVAPAGAATDAAAREAASQSAQLASEAHDRVADLEKKLAVTNQNIGQIVQILNQMRGAANAARPQTPAQPQG